MLVWPQLVAIFSTLKNATVERGLLELAHLVFQVACMAPSSKVFLVQDSYFFRVVFSSALQF